MLKINLGRNLDDGLKRLLFATALLPAVTFAASVQCLIGTARCINSQGTQIPSKQVIEILDRCAEFTRGDVGRIALRLSYKEINDRSGNSITPLVKAWYAFDDIYDSPLRFDRKANAEETRYLEIKRSCQQLERDFNDDSKWTK
ncbi:MAG: hypothetical protein M0P95_12915 [Sulfuritalea sp.]|jgi:hypothetical protein|nr:hypothetical protein [Sulfuritalea sp.]